MQSVDAEERVATVRTTAPEHEVYLTVEDRGSGFQHDSTSRMFDAFFTTKDDGMGMGLAISRTIAEAHRGRIWAFSGARGGATVTVALPRYHEE